MSNTVDVFWSFRSPYSRLVTPDLLKLRDDYNIDLQLRPVLPIAIRAPKTLFEGDNKKRARYIVMDSVRRGKMLGRPIIFPTRPDPVVQDYKTYDVPEEQPYIFRLTKLGVEANRRGKGLELADRVSDLIFSGTDGWDQGDKLANAVAEAGLDLAELDQAIDGGDHMQDVERNQDALDASGQWGVPTMVFNDEPFFGQDRVETLAWRLDEAGLKKS